MTKKSKLNQKYLIIAAALALAMVGYYGYKKALSPVGINKITPEEGVTPARECEKRGDNYVWTGNRCKKTNR